MKKNKKAFTLVELIVVLIIIVILGTIAYYSLQGHNKDARNSIRLSALSSFEEQLELYSVKTGGLPIPEDYVEIYSSGVLIGYQGYLGERILGLLNIKGGKDPLDEEYYTYMVDTKRRNFEIMAFLEESEMIFNIPRNIYADNSKRIPSVKGKKLGIIVNQTNDPIQKLITGSFDIANTNDIYKSYLNNETIITGTGIELRKASPTYSCERIFELSKKTITGNYNINNHYSTGSTFLNVNCDLDLDGLTPIIKNIGGSLNENISSIKIDSNGFIYISGTINSTNINFFGENISTNGGADFYIAKLDNNLNLIWVKHGGSTTNDIITTIDIDENGYIYTGGYFSGNNTNIFGEIFSTVGGLDYFVAKLDTNGNTIWVKHGGGTSTEYIYSIKTNSNGEIYVLGYFTSNNANIFGETISTNGVIDYILAKLDSNGNTIWLKHGGGTSNELLSNIEINNNGEIYISGNFNSPNNVNIFGETITTNGENDYILAKLDSNGNTIWLKHGGGIGSDNITNIKLDKNGNIFVGGIFSGENTNILGKIISSNGLADYFFTKLNKDGDIIWIKLGGKNISNIGLDSYGYIYILGFFNNTSNIFGKNITSKGGNDIYIAKIDSNGNLIWLKNGGGSGNDNGQKIELDSNENIYFGGVIFENTTLFNKNLIGNGLNDFFLIKLFK